MPISTITAHFDTFPGQRLFVRGEGPLDWAFGQPMEPISSRSWRLKIEHQTPLEFKFRLDDRAWSQGAKNYRILPGQRRNFYPRFTASDGWESTVWQLPHWNRLLNIQVYRPPGFQRGSQQRYPVIYCLDGQNLFAPRQTPFGLVDWRLDENLNSLINQNEIVPALVVAIDHRPDHYERLFDSTPSRGPKNRGGGAWHFAQFLVHEVKRRMDREFPTLTDPENTGLLGSSMGGLFALYAVREFPEVFGRVAAMSPSFWWDAEHIYRDIDASQRHDPQRIYLDAGTKEGEDPDMVVRQVFNVKRALEADGWEEEEDLKVEIFQGAEHNEVAWSQPWRIGTPLSFLFPWSG